jgi:hypothetical protein
MVRNGFPFLFQGCSMDISSIAVPTDRGAAERRIMSISGIGNYNYANGYAVKNSSNETGSQFVDTVAEKSVASKVDYDEKAFDYVAPNAPEKVKEAWMEAAKEMGTNGMGMAQNGMLTHISAMMVNRAENWMNGIENHEDILGDSVESALESAKQALYDLDNPLEPVTKRSLAVQQEIMKEREFYQAFISKLETLQDD